MKKLLRALVQLAATTGMLLSVVAYFCLCGFGLLCLAYCLFVAHSATTAGIGVAAVVLGVACTLAYRD